MPDRLPGSCPTCERLGYVVVTHTRTVAEHHPNCDGYTCESSCPIPVPYPEYEREQCPDCIGGFDRERIERAIRLAIDAVAAEIGFMPTEEALKALWLGVPVAVRAFLADEGTE